jgi:hypothetical protein
MMIVFYIGVAIAYLQAHASVAMRDIKAVTLVAGRVTAARRGPAVPQLECRGSLCTEEFMPKTAQCYNMGSDGKSVQWKCDAELDNRVKFGRTEVSCEGFEFTGDTEVLVGSCGLEYELLNSGNGGVEKRSDRGTGVKNENFAESVVAVFSFFLVVLVLFYVFTCLCGCCRANYVQPAATYVAAPPVIVAQSPPIVVQSGGSWYSPWVWGSGGGGYGGSYGSGGGYSGGGGGGTGRGSSGSSGGGGGSRTSSAFATSRSR